MGRFVAGLLLLVGAAAEAQDTRRLLIQRSATGMTVVRDCYIWEDSPNSNGNSSTLYTGRVGVGSKNTFLWFDVSAVPANALLREARLLLENTGHGGAPIEIRPASIAWTETQPTWTTFSTAFESNVVTTFTPVLGRNFIDVTPTVKQWLEGVPNTGLVLLQVPGSASATFHSSEISTQSLRPALEVLYEMPKQLTATEVPALTATCNATLTYPLKASAPDATSWTPGEVPEGLNVNAEDGVLTWRPTNRQRGLHEFSVKAAKANETVDLPLSIEVRCLEPFRLGCSSLPGGTVAALALLFARRRRQVVGGRP